jgi:hypothetical protein
MYEKTTMSEFQVLKWSKSVRIALPRNKVISSTHRNLDPNLQSHVDLHKSSNDNPKENVQKLKGPRKYQRAMLTHELMVAKRKRKVLWGMHYFACC